MSLVGSPLYAPVPNDTYWDQQWYLENRNAEGNRQGVDMNARAAWAQSTGKGIIIGIADNGVELSHPDLASQGVADFHFNFENNTPDGNHPVDYFFHGTPTAGFAVAAGNNNRGVIGMAPDAKFASWVVLKTNTALPGLFVSSEKRAEMFRFKNQEVQIQNHDWIHETLSLVEMSPIEDQAIQEAVTQGRGGKGVVMVHAAGNWRAQGRNANDDAYVADPRSIAVAGVRPQGRAASYSNPGANILVAAPGGEFGFGTLFTTDRQGSLGFNQINFGNDLADYVFGLLGIQGTSAAAPLIAGTAALMLSANPELTYRDVQQILLLSAKQTDLDDPGLSRNGAGLLASHNTGFGVPDAAFAVHLSKQWKGRPEQERIVKSITESKEIPDKGLKLHVTSGENLQIDLQTLPSLGIHADAGTEPWPLAHVGQATQPLTTNLTGKAALIQRGGADFVVKINHAADAGAAFAVIYNNSGGDAVQIPGGTDFAKIPAVFISQNDGESLVTLSGSDPSLRVSIELTKTNYQFEVTESFSSEQVGVRLQSNHPVRGDLRITLVSPSGTRSVLQTINGDSRPGPTNHVYWSTHHFFENAKGTWTLEVSDQFPGSTGSVTFAELQVLGTPLHEDSDLDGLQDTWELSSFGNLSQNGGNDPDQDGFSNLLESLLTSNPTGTRQPVEVYIAKMNGEKVRLSVPSTPFMNFDLLMTEDVSKPFTPLQQIPAYYPEAEFFPDTSTTPHQFFTIQRAD
ncbi:MAG: S8 family serine peptidase [Verrucomicrobiales bacterium]